MSIGNFARRAMELGSFPRRGVECDTVEHDTPLRHALSHLIVEKLDKSTLVQPLPAIRLIEAMRQIDPDLARMIESLAPVYLVKG